MQGVCRKLKEDPGDEDDVLLAPFDSASRTCTKWGSQRMTAISSEAEKRRARNVTTLYVWTVEVILLYCYDGPRTSMKTFPSSACYDNTGTILIRCSISLSALKSFGNTMVAVDSSKLATIFSRQWSTCSTQVLTLHSIGSNRESNRDRKFTLPSHRDCSRTKIPHTYPLRLNSMSM